MRIRDGYYFVHSTIGISDIWGEPLFVLNLGVLVLDRDGAIGEAPGVYPVVSGCGDDEGRRENQGTARC